MVKRFFIFVALVSIIGAGYFTYEKWVKDLNLSLWSFIPDTSLGVYESTRLKSTLEHLTEQTAWKNLNLIKEVNSIERSMHSLDSMLDEKHAFINTFDKSKFLISLHVVSKTSLDFLFVFELPKIKQQGIISRLETSFKKASYSRKTREYLGFNITELTSPEGKTFTYILYKNYFIGSKSAFLVEDAIRTQSEKDFLDFAERNPELYQLAKLEKDQGNIYFNMARLEDFLNVFLQSPVKNDFSKSSFLDLQVEGSTIELSGFVIPESEDYLSNFTGIAGAPFDLAEIIPNETSLIYHFSFSNSDNWKNSILTQLNSQHKALKQSFIADADFDVDYLYTLLDQEVVTGWYGEQNLPFMFLEINNSEEAGRFLKNAAERFVLSRGDSLYREAYKEYEIIKLPFQKFPNAFMGELSGDFRECFFASYRNYILFTDELPVLKEILNSIEDESTWGKSVRKNQFLQKTNQEAVFSIFVDLPNFWNILVSRLNEEWQITAKSYDFVFKNFQNIAIQFNPVDDKFYANILAEQPEGNILETSTETVESLTLSAPIVIKPYLVKNHINGLYETIIQDSANTMYLVGNDFSVQWSKTLEGRIISDISQVDFYKNNKLQYAFITENKFHIIDRTGEYLPGYPIQINGADPLKYFSVIDYDGSKRYRFSFVDKKGNVFLTDKNGSTLEGWSPLKMGHVITSPVDHFRIGGTDVFVVTLSNGELHLLSRRAINFPGFPIKLNEPVSSPYHLKQGSNFATTELTIVTDNGQLITINLKGKTINRTQLLKSEVNTHFQILNDISQKYYLITEGTSDRLSVLSSDATPLFEKDYLSEQSPFIQYYRLSSSQQYLVAGERKGEFIYIYDTDGRLITNRPLPGNNPLSMLYFEEENALQVYLADQTELKQIRISR